MAVVTVQFQVMNDVQFSRMFETIDEQIKDFSPLFDTLSSEFYRSMMGVFAAEGAFEGRGRWTSLSPAYAAWKEKHYPGRKILERTGALTMSLTSRGSMGNVTEITPTSMTVGTRIPYARYHQTGTARMPMRKIIELSDEQKRRWTSAVHEFLYRTYDDAARMTRGAQ